MLVNENYMIYFLIFSSLCIFRCVSYLPQREVRKGIRYSFDSIWMTCHWKTKRTSLYAKAWTEEEVQNLILYYNSDWKDVAAKLKRSPSACKRRFFEEMKMTSPSLSDFLNICKAVEMHGEEWDIVAKQINSTAAVLFTLLFFF
jgi:hypothetical protein